MIPESVWGSNCDVPLFDDVNWIKPRRAIVTQATEALSEVGALGLLVILAAKESIYQRRKPPFVDIEHLREYGDWVD